MYECLKYKTPVEKEDTAFNSKGRGVVDKIPVRSYLVSRIKYMSTMYTNVP